ncbi:MAG: helix-hairpin-helix domain-containing protein [Planctomycetota bacterium]|nr:helix-hairpin-helix domain-containing protein [Planctomycetota bacterium]
MITRITGKLVHLSETSATLEIGPMTYEVFIPEFVRRQMQSMADTDVTLKTIHYLDGNPQQGRLYPRLVGFMNDAEREFFELVCSVDGVGMKKALRAMVRPVREVATAIEEQDIKQLSTLPGIGPAVGERIIAKLRRKMAKFALMVDRDLPELSGSDVLNDGYEALQALGHSAAEAREKIEAAANTKKKFKTVEDLLMAVYNNERGG